MMERKSGHNQKEVDKILREAEERKRQAERENQEKISQEQAVREIEKLGPGALQEKEDNLRKGL